jgi:TRAP-type C4-dicarboxylate transport system substrate-binding protein
VPPGTPVASAVALLIAALVGCGGSDGDREPQPGASQARYEDPVGDGGQLPDIRGVEVSSAPTGVLTFRVHLDRFTARTKTIVDLWFDTDADPETGNTTFEGADGAEYSISVFLGRSIPDGPYCGLLSRKDGCFSKWSPESWLAAAAPSARAARTADGFKLAINRRDLGDTDELNFFAVRGAESPGYPDRAPGRGTYNYSIALGGPRPPAPQQAGRRPDKAGGSERQRPVVLTLGTHDYLETDPVAAAFVAAAKRRSEDSLKLDVREGWRYYDRDYERATISDVVRRDLDIALVGARAWDVVGVTSFRALLAPFLIDSFALQERALKSPVVERMLDGVEARGLVGLGVLPGSLRRPLGITRPLVGPSDYRGAAMAIRPGGVAKATFKALGGSSRDFRADELPGFEGSEVDVTTILNNRYDRHAEALTANVVLWPRPTTVVVNGKAFDSLTSEQRELLRSAVREALEPALEVVRNEEQASLETLCQAGLRLVRASPPQRAALREAVQPVYDELERDSVTRELIDEIEALRSGLPPITPLRCAGARARTVTSPLDGTWRADPSSESLAAAGASQDEIQSLTGPLTLELADGRWVGRVAQRESVVRGTYSVDGGVVRFTVDSCTPTRACKVDQVTEYRWSVYRDKLTLSRSRRFALPAFVAEPWTRAR